MEEEHKMMFICKLFNKKKAKGSVNKQPTHEEFGEFENVGLYPVDDIEIDSSHNYLLNKALSQNSKDIKNIAITGLYGSGKSSLVLSYLRSKDIDHVQISLAEFNNDGMINDANDGGLDAIEQKIIAQLASRSSSDKEKWSFTTFQTAQAAEGQRKVQASLVVVLIFIAVFAISKMPGGPVIFIGLDLSALAFILLLIFLGVFICKYGEAGYPPLFKTISLNSFSVTFGEHEDGASYFDKNLAAILQMVDELKENVIVFEDIDRLNQPALFTRLRELNQVINSHVGDDRVIKFVYCLRDNVFSGKEKVKFFDIIIPVLPVQSGYNSFGAIKNELSARYFNELDETFIRNVALYLDDLRLIKNTVVEYKVYYSHLDADNRSEIDRNKLFALITLKNLHPESFYKLEMRTGRLYEYLSPFKENEFSWAKKDARPNDLEGSEIRKVVEDAINSEEIVNGDNYQQGKLSVVERLKSYLVYVLEHGYLDSSFFCYLSQIDDQTISTDDQSWLLKARNGQHNFSQRLNSPSNIMMLLKDEDYKNPDLLNVSLFEALLDDRDKKSTEIDGILKAARNQTEFINAATLKIAEFPYLAVQKDPGYFSDLPQDKGANGQLLLGNIAIAIAAYAGQNDNFQIDDSIIPSMDETLADHIGSIEESYLDLLIQDNPGTLENIENVLSCNNIVCNELSKDVDIRLFNSLLEGNHISFTPENCKIILALTSGFDDGKDAVEQLRDSSDARAWTQIIENPNRFVDDYWSENVELKCSEKCFLELLNSVGQDDEVVIEKLVEIYRGIVSDVGSVTNTTAQERVIDHRKFKKSLANVFRWLDIRGMDGDWIKYVNEVELSIDDEFEIDDENSRRINENIKDFCKLNIDKFELIAGRLKNGAIIEVSPDCTKEQINFLLDHDKIELNTKTIEGIRKADVNCKLSFYLRNLDKYIQIVNVAGEPDIKVIPSILNEISSSISVDTVSQLIDLLNVKIDSSEYKFSDEILGQLLISNKLKNSNDVILRYGDCSKELNEKILGYLKEMTDGEFKKYDLSSGLIFAMLPTDISDTKKLRCFEILINQGNPGEFLKGLKIANCTVLADVFEKNRHPSKDDLTELEQELIPDLEDKNWLSVGKNNGLLYKKSGRG